MLLSPGSDDTEMMDLDDFDNKEGHPIKKTHDPSEPMQPSTEATTTVTEAHPTKIGNDDNVHDNPLKKSNPAIGYYPGGLDPTKPDESLIGIRPPTPEYTSSYDISFRPTTGPYAYDTKKYSNTPPGIPIDPVLMGLDVIVELRRARAAQPVKKERKKRAATTTKSKKTRATASQPSASASANGQTQALRELLPTTTTTTTTTTTSSNVRPIDYPINRAQRRLPMPVRSVPMTTDPGNYVVATPPTNLTKFDYLLMAAELILGSPELQGGNRVNLVNGGQSQASPAPLPQPQPQPGPTPTPTPTTTTQPPKVDKMRISYILNDEPPVAPLSAFDREFFSRLPTPTTTTTATSESASASESAFASSSSYSSASSASSAMHTDEIEVESESKSKGKNVDKSGQQKNGYAITPRSTRAQPGQAYIDMYQGPEQQRYEKALLKALGGRDLPYKG